MNWRWHVLDEALDPENHRSVMSGKILFIRHIFIKHILHADTLEDTWATMVTLLMRDGPRLPVHELQVTFYL